VAWLRTGFSADARDQIGLEQNLRAKAAVPDVNSGLFRPISNCVKRKAAHMEVACFPGQKIVSVNPAYPSQVSEWGSNLPRVGEIYTIRWIRIFLDAKRTQVIAVVLEESCNPDNRLHFHIERFLPVISGDEPTHEIVIGYAKEAASLGRFANFPPSSQIATF